MPAPVDESHLDYTSYHRAAAQRVTEERRALRARYQRAWKVARHAADVLREHYTVQRVVLFGSLLDQERFKAHSDVDLAVWGIGWPAYLHALGEMLELDEEIEVNLVDIACSHPLLREVIEREGREL